MAVGFEPAGPAGVDEAVVEEGVVADDDDEWSRGAGPGTREWAVPWVAGCRRIMR